MYKGKTFLAVIPARGGSKGIPSKNIIDVGGRKLIEYTVDCASDSMYIDRTIISTDSEKIKEISENYIKNNNKKVDIPFLRPKELAEDNSKTIDTLIHTIEYLKNSENKQYDYIILLQNTSPLRKSYHVDEAIEKIVNSDKNSIVGVNEVKENPILIRKINNDGNLERILEKNSTLRRQDFPKFYKVNGSVYIYKYNEYFTKETSLNDGEMPYLMEEKYGVDIDNYIDIKIVEYYLEKEKEEKYKKMR